MPAELDDFVNQAARDRVLSDRLDRAMDTDDTDGLDDQKPDLSSRLDAAIAKATGEGGEEPAPKTWQPKSWLATQPETFLGPSRRATPDEITGHQMATESIVEEARNTARRQVGTPATSTADAMRPALQSILGPVDKAAGGIFSDAILSRFENAPQPTDEAGIPQAWRQLYAPRKSPTDRSSVPAALETQREELATDGGDRDRLVRAYEQARMAEDRRLGEPNLGGRHNALAESLGAEPPDLRDHAANMVSAFMRALSHGGATIPKEISIAAKSFGEFLNKSWGTQILKGKDAKDMAFYQLGKALDQFTEEYIPPNPVLRDSFVSEKLPGAAGSMAEFILGGAAAKALKLPSAMAVGLMGAAGEGAAMYERGVDQGKDETRRLLASAFALPIGASEVVGAEWVFRQFDKATRGAFSRAFFERMSEGLKGGGIEATEELLQGAAGQMVANQLYDENKWWIDRSTGEDAASAGIIGVLATLVAQAAGARRLRSMAADTKETTPTQPVVEKRAPIIPEIIPSTPPVTKPGGWKKGTEAWAEPADKKVNDPVVETPNATFAVGDRVGIKGNVTVGELLKIEGGKAHVQSETGTTGGKPTVAVVPVASLESPSPHLGKVKSSSLPTGQIKEIAPEIESATPEDSASAMIKRGDALLETEDRELRAAVRAWHAKDVEAAKAAKQRADEARHELLILRDGENAITVKTAQPAFEGLIGKSDRRRGQFQTSLRRIDDAIAGRLAPERLSAPADYADKYGELRTEARAARAEAAAKAETDPEAAGRAARRAKDLEAEAARMADQARADESQSERMASLQATHDQIDADVTRISPASLHQGTEGDSRPAGESTGETAPAGLPPPETSPEATETASYDDFVEELDTALEAWSGWHAENKEPSLADITRIVQKVMPAIDHVLRDVMKLGGMKPLELFKTAEQFKKQVEQDPRIRGKLKMVAGLGTMSPGETGAASVESERERPQPGTGGAAQPPALPELPGPESTATGGEPRPQQVGEGSRPALEAATPERLPVVKERGPAGDRAESSGESGVGDADTTAGGRASVRDGAGAGERTDAAESLPATVADAPAVESQTEGIRHTDAPAPSVAGDYIIKPDDPLFEGGEKTRADRNLRAIEVLRDIEKTGRTPTLEDQAQMVLYTGWGSIPGIFESYKREWSSRHEKLRELLSTEEFNAARRSTLNAMYTPPDVIRGMYRALERMGFQGGRLLEPSMGVGHFFGLMPAALRTKTRRVGVELDRTTAGLAKALYPQSDVRHGGYEEQRLPDEFFDVVIGNVPFGNYQIADDSLPKFLRQSIHDYFIAKAVMQTRPRGVVAVITSRFTMDKVSDSVRTWINERAALIGAVRLNERSLPGTEVVADILFLQRRDGENQSLPNEQRWTDAVQIKTADGAPSRMNEYFTDHPEMVLGTIKVGDMHGRYDPKRDPVAPLTVDPLNKEEPNGGLDEALSHLPRNVMKDVRAAQDLEQLTEPAFVAPTTADTLPDGAWRLTEKGEAYRDGKKADVGSAAMAKLRDMVTLRDAALKTLNAQLQADALDEEIDAARAELNKTYDRITKKTKLTIARRALGDDLFSQSIIDALEVYDPKTKTRTKAPIFTQRIIEPYAPLTTAGDVDEALNASLADRGAVDIAAIATLVGKTETETRRELLDRGLIYETPGGKTVTADEYLSGDVRAKLKEAVSAAQVDAKFNRNVEGLRRVLPADLGREDVDISLGATWLDNKIIEDFTKHLFGSRVNVEYVPLTGTWIIDDKLGMSRTVAAQQTWGTSRMDGVKLLKAAITLDTVTVKDKLGEDLPAVRNEAATIEAQAKLAAIKEEWTRWLWSDPTRSAMLLEQYNDAFNGIVPRTYPDTPLPLPGMNPAFHKMFRPYQHRGVRAIVWNGNRLLFHPPGAGKTFVLVASAVELRRLKLARKPLIVVHNETLEQFYATAQAMYPGARFLMVTPEMMTKKGRARTNATIATQPYDAIIMPHSTFDRIPLGEQTLRQFFGERIKELRRAMEEESDKKTVKEMEKALLSLETKLKAKMAGLKTDRGFTFEQLGIDYVMYDESQYAKNLFFQSTSLKNVKGIGQAEGSDRAFHLYMIGQYLQKMQNGRGLVYATGTPIANSVAEMFHLTRQLAGDMLAKRGIETIDGWVQAFGEVTEDVERVLDADYRKVTRLRRFQNLGDLLRMFRDFTDVVTPDELRQYVSGLPVIAENSQGEREWENVILPETAGVKRGVQHIASQAQWIRKHFKEAKALGLNFGVLSTKLRQLGVDPRLVFEDEVDDPGSKINAVAERVSRIFDDTSDKKSTQLVIMNQGVHPSKKSGFHGYADLIAKLVAKGIPREQIATLQETENNAALFAKVNEGDVRVLISSIQRVGVGVNIQRKLKALHLMDPPWRPDEIEQAVGRIIRFGNENPEINLIRYAIKGSGDELMYNRLFTKKRAIDSIARGDLSLRRMEEIETEALGFAEIAALATKNPILPEYTKQTALVARLNTLKAAHDTQTAKAARTIANLTNNAPKVQRDLDNVKADIAQREDAEPFAIELAGNHFDDRTDAARYLVDQVYPSLPEAFTSRVTLGGNTKVYDGKVIGRFRGFELTAARVDPVMRAGHKFEIRLSDAKYGWDTVLPHEAEMTDAAARGALSRLEKMVKTRMDDKLAELSAHAIELRRDLEESKGLIDAPFEKADELIEAERKLAELEVALRSFEEAATIEAKAPDEGEYSEDDEIPAETTGDETFVTPADEERLKAFREKEPSKPSFGMGAMFNVPDIDAWHQRVFDRIKAKLRGLEEKAVVGPILKAIGGGIYGSFGMKADVWRWFRKVVGTTARFKGDVTELTDWLDERFEDLEAEYGKNAAKELNKSLAAVLDGTKPIDALGDDDRAMVERFAAMNNAITDELLNSPELHPYIEAFGLRNIMEVIKDRRESGGVYLRRLYYPRRSLAKVMSAVAPNEIRVNLGVPRPHEQRRTGGLKEGMFVDIVRIKDGHTADGVAKARIEEISDPDTLDNLTDELMVTIRLDDDVHNPESLTDNADEYRVYAHGEWKTQEAFRDPNEPKIVNVGPRVRGSQFQFRRADYKLWTLRHVNGEYTQYSDFQDAAEQRDREIAEYRDEFGRSVEDRVYLIDPFGQDVVDRLDPIDDVRQRMVKTILDSINNLEVLKLFHRLAETVAEDDRRGDPGYQLLMDSPALGPLAGKYVPTPVAQNIMAVRTINQGMTDQFLDVWSYTWKTSRTVLNAGTWARNIQGLTYNWFLDGINPVADLPLFRRAAKEMMERGPIYKRIADEGILQTGFARTEVQELLTRIDDSSSIGRALLEWLTWASDKVEVIGRGYDMPDQISKIASYLYKTETLGMTHEDAIERVNASYPNYDEAGNLARWSRSSKVGKFLGSPFITYSTEQTRITINALRDRPGRLLALWLAPGLVSLASQLILGLGDDDEDKLLLSGVEQELADRDSQRRTTATNPTGWMQRYFQPLLPWRSGDGRLMHLDLRWVFPLANDFRVESAAGVEIPFVLSSPWVDTAVTAFSGVDTFTGRQLWERDTPYLEKVGTLAAKAGESLLPSTPVISTRGLGRIYRAAKEDGAGGAGLAIMGELAGVRPRPARVSRDQAYELLKGKVQESKASDFEEAMRLYETYRDERDKPINPRSVIRSAAKQTARDSETE